MGQHGLQRAAVLALEQLQLDQPRADFFQPLRIEFDPRVVVLQKLGDLGHADLRRADLLERFLEVPVDPCQILQLVAGQHELIVHGVFRLVEQFVKACRGLVELLGIFEDAQLGFERFLFAFLWIDPVDFLDLERVALFLLLQLAATGHERLAFPDQAGHLFVVAPVGIAESAQAAEVVEQFQVRFGAEQALMFVLAVQVDELRRHLTKELDGGRRVVDESAALAGQDLAAHDELRHRRWRSPRAAPGCGACRPRRRRLPRRPCGRRCGSFPCRPARPESS